MRSSATQLEILTLEERLLAGSYFGAPTGDGVTSPLSLIPRRRGHAALVKSASKHHAGIPADAADTVLFHHPLHTAAVGTPAQGDSGPGGTTTGTVSAAAAGSALPVGSLTVTPNPDPSQTLVSTDLGVGTTPPSDPGLGTSGPTEGPGSGCTMSGTVGSLPAGGGPASTAPAGAVGTSTTPPVSTDPVSVSACQGTAVINSLGLGHSAPVEGPGIGCTMGGTGNPLPVTGGPASTATAGAVGTSTTPPVSTDPVSVSVCQGTGVIGSVGLGQSGGGGSSSGPADGLTIPEGHPRVWFNADPRLMAQAQAYYAQNPLHPSSGDPLGNALVYVLTGDTNAAAVTVNALMNFTISDAELQSTASDNYRWNGWVPVAYDWVHDAMTPDQRQTFTDRYNYYAFTMMNKSWGGPGMPANDYFWGYFANELNWAIATYYENPMAQTFLDDALITRWQNSFVPWAATAGLGGVTPEGTEYGRADLAYPALPLTTAALMGGDQYAQTNYYKEAIFNLIYTTSPAPTYSKESANPYYMPFPFGEDEHNGGYPSVTDSTYYGDFMQAAANAYGNLAVGQYAYHWLQTVQPQQTYYTAPFYLNTPTYRGDLATPDYSRLPVDYYAPGAQDFYTRNQWGEQATSVFLQLGSPSPNVLDSGSFQIWRNGWFVSKETTGYDLQINGGMSEDPVAHNTLLFGGQGIARAWRNGDPQVLRLQSDPVFSYAAVDMSPAFGSSYPSLANPYAAHAVREFLFIKPLETMVILDRMESSDAAEPAADVTKTFLVHFPNQPQVTGTNTVIGYSGDQALRLTTLLPSNPSYNVVDEGAFNGQHDADPAFYQYRLEANTSGSAQSYFLNVLQARDANGSNVVSHLTQNATSWTITLDNPALGHAQIILNKGMDSQGGAVGYSATGTPTEFTPLLDHVQGIQVTDYGPVWGN
jgi:hypothetical protein